MSVELTAMRQRSSDYMAPIMCRITCRFPRRLRVLLTAHVTPALGHNVDLWHCLGCARSSVELGQQYFADAKTVHVAVVDIKVAVDRTQGEG